MSRDLRFVVPASTVRVTLTGSNCALACAHCGGVYLGGMRSAEEVLAAPREPASGRPVEPGRPTCLVSGGCDARGRVPVRENEAQLRRLAARFRINLHTGVPDDDDAAVARDVAEVVSLDWVTEDATIDEVYGNGRKGADYERALDSLMRAGCVVVPHICVGLRGGRVSGEMDALERLASVVRAAPGGAGKAGAATADARGRVAAVTFLVLVPTRGTRFEHVSPPGVDQVSRIVESARRMLGDLPLMVGCMRPSGAYREELDPALLSAGAEVFVNPSRSLQVTAGRLRDVRGIRASRDCCSFLVSGRPESPGRAETLDCAGEGPIPRGDEVSAAAARPAASDTIRVSSGTLAVLGLGTTRCEVFPTTAYLLTPGGCSRDCGFCAQAAGSRAARDRLSRVLWPEISMETLLSALVGRADAGAGVGAGAGADAGAGVGADAGTTAGACDRFPVRLRRVCLQVTGCADSGERVLDFLARLRSRSGAAGTVDPGEGRVAPALHHPPVASLLGALPVSLSWLPWGPEGVDYAIACIAQALSLGADRIGISLDAATSAVYSAVKLGPAAQPSPSPSWDEGEHLLTEAARRFRGRVTTHLIIGLGESEREALTRLSELVGRGVTVGLFAFTPLKGTRLAGAPRPDLARYRRVQLARFVMHACGLGWEVLDFDRRGQVVWGSAEGLGLIGRACRAAESATGGLRDPRGPEEVLGWAFRTSGCRWCNRPYYNETPGQDMYNYPRPLSSKELTESLVLAGLAPRDARELALASGRLQVDG